MAWCHGCFDNDEQPRQNRHVRKSPYATGFTPVVQWLLHQSFPTPTTTTSRREYPPMSILRFTLAAAIACCCVTHNGEAIAQSKQTIRFDQQVRPILSNHCWSCHGLDEGSREGNLRLDVRDNAIAAGDSGELAIVPGHPEKSQLIARIDSHDPEAQMPPLVTKKPLTAEQKQILKQWIAEGAEYSGHWAFETPKRPEPPAIAEANWARNPVDQFIAYRLQQEGLHPSVEAAPHVWLRRVTLDLTGLPPSLEELAAFETALKTSPREQVYSEVVDRLLKSPHYGERMAMQWLDAARYADTNGYNNDETRTMWPWRDWVINAFSSGMPYDQFLTEQLAGDLLPNPTIGQRVATGFSRNHVLTTEGGIIEEEYHVEYVADRVHTTSTVFLAMSMQCARCHDHKYDPISQRDYYQFASFFNNVPDKVVSYNKARMAEPLLKVPSAKQTAELQKIETRLVEIDQVLKERAANVTEELKAWEASLTPDQIAAVGPIGLRSHLPLDETDGERVGNRVIAEQSGTIKGSVLRKPGRLGQALEFDGSNYVDAGQIGDFDNTDKFSISVWIQLASNDIGTVLSKMDDDNAYRGYDLMIDGGKIAAHFVSHWPDNGFRIASKNPVSLNEWHHLVVTYDGSKRAAGVKLYVDGVSQEIDVTTNNELSGSLKTDKPFHIGRRHKSVPFKGLVDDVQLFGSEMNADEVSALAKGETFAQLAELLKTPAAERWPEQQQLLVQYYVNQVDATAKALRAERAELPKRRTEIENEIPATMVMSEPSEPRPAFILKRGQYDQRGDHVESEFPQALSNAVSASAEQATNKKTRLDLAQWLTDPKHPLTARVAVNRWWEMLFGMGLVETSEDFGSQGAFPSHPELLDWLATELIAQHWDQRAILRQIVLSATYRQSSNVTPELLQKDPRNTLLARGPRYRLPAETVRDQALFVSGLFSQRIGGPSVRPYQPEGLWEDVSVERRDKYVPDAGEGLYRRSMYTFWKRTCPPPGMATFDAPDREFCLVRRARTNTPLQALVLLNDPTFVEASRKLAERCLNGASDVDSRIDLAFRLVLSRQPDQAERQTIKEILDEATKAFTEEPAAAEEYLTIGASPRDVTLPPVELAAWSAAMSVLLNLDEAISKL